MVETPLGPDGMPAVFDGAAWVSHDRTYWWNGGEWQPLKKGGFRPPWVAIVLGIGAVAIAAYILSNLTADSGFALGFYFGNGLYLLVLAVIFRFVGRWGWVGTAIRFVVAALFLLRILALFLTSYHP